MKTNNQLYFIECINILNIFLILAELVHVHCTCKKSELISVNRIDIKMKPELIIRIADYDLNDLIDSISIIILYNIHKLL
jgi:hypothetical protein